MTLEEQLRAQGGDWDIGGVDRAAELADLLRKQGITSLGALSLTGDYDQQKINANLRPMSRSGNESATDETLAAGSAARSAANTRRLKIGDQEVGFLGDYNLDGTYGSKAQGTLQDGTRLGWSARGDGNVAYNVQTGPDGKISIVPTWGSSSDADKLRYPLLGALAFTGVGLAANAGLLGAGVGAGTTGAGAGAGAAAGGIGAADAAAALGGVADAGAAGGAAVAAPSAGVYGAGLGAETAAGLVAPGAAGGGGALLAAPGAAGVGAAAAGGALASLPSWLPEGLAPAWDFIKGNPRLVGALAGGLLGAASSDTEDEAPAPYTGPMPTITRGNFQASAMSGYKPMAQQSYGGGLLATPGTRQPASGMGRYMGLLGG